LCSFPASFCTICGAKISESSNFCSKCGEKKIQDEVTSPNVQEEKESENKKTTKSSPIQRPLEWKSEGTALILAIVLGFFGIAGIGQVYAGKLGKGLIILIVGIILYVVGIVTLFIVVGFVLLIIYIPLWIWSILDSRTLVREYNDYLEEHGKRPW